MNWPGLSWAGTRHVMARSKHHTGMAGTFAVGAELSRRGYDIALTLGNTPTIDVLCASPNGRPFKVQVKSAASANFVPIGKAWLEAAPDENLYLFVVLVPRLQEIRLSGSSSSPIPRRYHSGPPCLKPRRAASPMRRVGMGSIGCNPFDCALETHAATGSCVGTLLRI